MKININQDLVLIPIKIEDQQELLNLMIEVYPPAYQDFWEDDCSWYLDHCYNPKNLKKELSYETSNYFFVEFNGFKAGIFKYDFPFSPKEFDLPNAMKLHRLYLHEDIHGTGVAKALMEWAEKIAVENRLDYIWLEAMEQKPQAKRFYEKMGYELVYSYILDFELIKPSFRGIHIFQKKMTLKTIS